MKVPILAKSVTEQNEKAVYLGLHCTRTAQSKDWQKLIHHRLRFTRDF